MGYSRVYVPVIVAFGSDGKLIPRRLCWEGQVYTIDRVLDMRPAPAVKSGGQGDRYTIEVQGKQSYLFFEHNADTTAAQIGRWFVERRA